MTPTRRDLELAREVWSHMAELVDGTRRKREVCDETGLSWGKARALLRIAEGPLSMRELATFLVMDPPNVTTLIDDLQRARLLHREPHPSDRRVILVVITTEGAVVARRVHEIFERPPEVLVRLSRDDLGELRRILRLVR